MHNFGVVLKNVKQSSRSQLWQDKEPRRDGETAGRLEASQD